MKISGYCKSKGHDVKLLTDYNNVNDYDKVYLSKVFNFTNIPIDLTKHKRIKYGGTGFWSDKAPDLPHEIEHHMPDYHLYDEFIESEIVRGIKKVRYLDYLNYSIGFATRGCFRKCDFCVNRKYDKAVRHATIKEFYDPTRKYIYLWDDNILAYEKWHEVFEELSELNRPFQFRQGLDIRLMTEEKANIISKSKWKGDYIFAFDHIKDKDLIKNKLEIWKKYSQKTTKLFVLVAHDSQDINDIIGAFERIKILMQYQCLPYIMRYESYKNSQFYGMYVNLARWCNQPNFFKKKSFREFCEANGLSSSTYKYMRNFEQQYPQVAKIYFDIRFDNGGDT